MGRPTIGHFDKPITILSVIVNNKMLEYGWLLTVLIYVLIACFRSKLSDLTWPITNIW